MAIAARWRARAFSRHDMTAYRRCGDGGDKQGEGRRGAVVAYRSPSSLSAISLGTVACFGCRTRVLWARLRATAFSIALLGAIGLRQIFATRRGVMRIACCLPDTGWIIVASRAALVPLRSSLLYLARQSSSLAGSGYFCGVLVCGHRAGI